MKQFFLRHRKSVLIQSLRSAGILSLFVYAVLRCLFFEFPMTWLEEAGFFFKVFIVTVFFITTATAGSALLYRSMLKMRARSQSR